MHPSTSLSISPTGGIKPCCVTLELLGATQSSGLGEAFSSSRMELIRNNFRKGIIDRACLGCKDKESRGLQSKRQRFNRSFNQTLVESGYLEDEISSLDDNPNLLYLDLSLSNVCNMTCAMCSSEFSSSWIKYDKLARQEGLNFREVPTSLEKIQSVPQEIIEEIISLSVKLKVIIIKGGEPLADKNYLSLLSNLNQYNNRNKSMIIKFQTNGSLVSEEFLESTMDLNFEIGVSIDGIGDTYKWIRGVDYDLIKSNLFKLNDSENVKELYIDFTLSAYNIFNVEEFLEEALQLKNELSKLKSCSLFGRVQQSYGSVRALPVEERLNIAANCEKLISRDPEFFEDWESFLIHLREPEVVDYKDHLKQWVSFINNLRGFELPQLQTRIDKL